MKQVKKLDEKAILSRLSKNHWGQVHRPWSHRDRY